MAERNSHSEDGARRPSTSRTVVNTARVEARKLFWKIDEPHFEIYPLHSKVMQKWELIFVNGCKCKGPVFKLRFQTVQIHKCSLGIFDAVLTYHVIVMSWTTLLI